MLKEAVLGLIFGLAGVGPGTAMAANDSDIDCREVPSEVLFQLANSTLIMQKYDARVIRMADARSFPSNGNDHGFCMVVLATTYKTARIFYIGMKGEELIPGHAYMIFSLYFRSAPVHCRGNLEEASTDLPLCSTTQLYDTDDDLKEPEDTTPEQTGRYHNAEMLYSLK